MLQGRLSGMRVYCTLRVGCYEPELMLTTPMKEGGRVSWGTRFPSRKTVDRGQLRDKAEVASSSVNSPSENCGSLIWVHLMLLDALRNWG